MIEISVIIILIGSFIGMGVIIFRKIPVLSELAPESVRGPGVLTRFRDKIKNSKILKSFSKEILFQKILSKIRILTLKTDNKTSNWLAKLRQRTLEKKNKFSDDYWKKIRK